MLGLPVMVTGLQKQFFSPTQFEVLDCPHYLGVVSLLSCFISLWTALKNQIVICVLTLITGIVTVIAAMVVLVTSALALSESAVVKRARDPQVMTYRNSVELQNHKHLMQQTHVIFIFSIGILIASLAIVITALSHLSARRGKRGSSKRRRGPTSKVTDAPELERELPQNTVSELLPPTAHRYSFASTISSLIKQELKEVKSPGGDGREKLKKALSAPNERSKFRNSDILGTILGEGSSTHSLPADNSDINSTVVDRWRRASFLTKYYNEQGGSLEEVSFYIILVELLHVLLFP